MLLNHHAFKQIVDTNSGKKKRLWYRCFPTNFSKVLRKAFFIKQLRMTVSGSNSVQLKFMVTLFQRFPIELFQVILTIYSNYSNKNYILLDNKL